MSVKRDRCIRELTVYGGQPSCSSVVWRYLGIGDGPFSVPFRAFVFDELASIFFSYFPAISSHILWSTGKSAVLFFRLLRPPQLSDLPIYFVMLAIYLIADSSAAARRFCSAVHCLGGLTIIGLQNFWMVAEQSYGASWW